MKKLLPSVSLCGMMIGFGFVTANAADLPTGPGRLVDSKQHHVGTRTMTNWLEAAAPEAGRLDLRFSAAANASEVVLEIAQREVSSRCVLQVNGKDIAQLKRDAGSRVRFYPVAAGTFTNGQNVISILPRGANSDVLVGPIRLHEQPLRTVLRLQPVRVEVIDARTGQVVPARLTLTDKKDRRVELFYPEQQRTAMREGVLYTLGNETQFELPEGNYTIYATRGMEWSRPRQTFQVAPGKAPRLQLKIEREVDTTGFVAADTHIHTLTFSGHGDASVEERMVTLAAEGVEMAVSTDHNHNTDYRPYQEKICAGGYFTPMIGNEVTTPVGHMNGFPLRSEDPVPEYKLTNWVALVDGIRAKGAKVVILNHPRWPTVPTSCLTKFGFNRASGDFTNRTKFPFDGMELANALAPEPDPLYLFRDWFALLDHGERITAIGSSDSHTVDEPVGQGRSYIPSRTDDPTKIDVADACQRFLAGETSVALGIFADVLVDGRFRMGQTNSLREGALKVRLRVAAPSWVKPRRALLFLNGQVAAEKSVKSKTNRATDTWIEFAVDRPKTDAYVVCVVLGDGIEHPSWRTAEKFTLAATNPVYLDSDGDGAYSSPRETARVRLAGAKGGLEGQWEAIKRADDPVAVQMAALLSENVSGEELVRLQQHIREAARERPVFREFLHFGTAVIMREDLKL
jgi:hypothetical protein